MSDCISRAEAIEAVTKLCVDGYKAKVDGYFIPLTDALINTLSALPSAELVLQTPQTYGKSINPSNAEVVEDLIRRADAIELLTEIVFNELPEIGCDTFCRLYAEEKINKIPSADAEQGEWKIDEYGIYHCPFCHAINNTVYKSFCPNCGARMENKE